MKHRFAPLLAALVGLTLTATLYFAGPLVAAIDDDPDTIYLKEVQRITRQLDLSRAEAEQIRHLAAARKAKEQHLRKQMKTTLTPAQRQKLQEFGNCRSSGRGLSGADRHALRLRLGLDESQERQLELYRVRIADFQRETAGLIEERLRPDQRPLFQELSLQL